jgi:uncharacterized damage-inducible protein DinB
MTDRSFERDNDESRERLARLVATLTPADLKADLGEGWTVASALAHMGFWDRWQAGRLSEMFAGNWSAQDESVLASEHLANEALHPYWAGVAAADIPALALEAASSLDVLVAQAPDSVVDSLEGGPSAYLLHRHRHRGDHLDHIERVLAKSGVAEAHVDRSYVQRNTTSRQRLASIVERLGEADLQLLTEADGWTIAQVIGHLAFWDRFLAARWRSALASGAGAQPANLPHEVADLLNEVLAHAWGAAADVAGAGVREILAAAEAVDGIIAGLPGETPIDAILAERPALLDRSIHRQEHLEAIEAALAGRRGR